MKCDIKNANYELVISMIPQLLSDRFPETCACDRCISDIAATALNYLPPHYHASESREETGSPVIMVEAAVVEAIEKVAELNRRINHSSSSERH